MNSCITGALGHIGSSLIRNLKSRDIGRVFLIDNLNKQRYCSLFDLPNKPKFVFVETDILSKKMELIVKDSDIVIHLVAISDAESSIKEAAEVNRVNRVGLRHIVKLCSKYHKSLLFPSTTSVYGSSAKILNEESTGKNIQPQSPYAESKLYGEKYIMSEAQKKGFKYTILRFGTIFGYSIGMRFNTAVNKFVYQAATDQNITVWKTALNQKRPYCDLVDCISAINYVIESNLFNNQIYNIVTLNLTVKDIIVEIKKFIPQVKISFIKSAIMNKLSYSVSNEKSLKKGFKYSGNLNRSIKKYIQKLGN